jgi:hypothetical protein
MAATQFGTGLSLGAALGVPSLASLADYIIESATEGGADVDAETVPDADGAIVTNVVYQIDEKVSLTLICLAAATPLVDFVPGTNISTTWHVDSAPITKTKSPWRVQVELTNIGVS